VNALQNRYVFKIPHITNLYKICGISDRKDKVISRSKFNEIIDKIKPIESELRFAFKVIKHHKKDKDGKVISEDFGVRQCMFLLNAIFNDWAFIKVSRINRKRIRINREFVEISDIFIHFDPIYEYF